MIEVPEVVEAADEVEKRLNPPAPREWATVADQLDDAMRHRLSELFGVL